MVTSIPSHHIQNLLKPPQKNQKQRFFTTISMCIIKLILLVIITKQIMSTGVRVILRRLTKDEQLAKEKERKRIRKVYRKAGWTRYYERKKSTSPCDYKPLRRRSGWDLWRYAWTQQNSANWKVAGEQWRLLTEKQRKVWIDKAYSDNEY